MYHIERIVECRTLFEALSALSAQPDLKVIAGGTDVLIKLKKNHESVSLLSLEFADELRGIEIQADGGISIRPLTTFDMLVVDPVIGERVPILKQAAASMGGPQIRNRATVGGNLCNGAVSADAAPALLALDAVLTLARLEEGVYTERKIPLETFYLGPGKVDLLRGELLKEITIPEKSTHCKGAYIKYARRKAMDIALLGVAVLGSIHAETGIVEDLRIALGVAAPTPIRIHDAEAYCIGKKLDEATLATTCDLVVRGSKARDSWRASKEFREYLMHELSDILLTKLGKEADSHD